jgi:hypothetical protein
VLWEKCTTSAGQHWTLCILSICGFSSVAVSLEPSPVDTKGLLYFGSGMSLPVQALKSSCLLQCYWEVVETWRDRAYWEVLGHWGHSLEGDCETLVCSSFFLLLPGHEGSCISSQYSPAMTLPRHRTKINGDNKSWTKTSNTVNQNKPFLFVCWLRSQIFVRVTGSCLVQNPWERHGL